jgi:hypothetical protein
VTAMNWKRQLKLTDLDATTDIEMTCQRCGITRYKRPDALLKDDALRHAYLDEAEKHLRCEVRACRGLVRLALIHDDKTEGFVGGMA